MVDNEPTCLIQTLLPLQDEIDIKVLHLRTLLIIISDMHAAHRNQDPPTQSGQVVSMT
jgi:hypothetical protein